MSKLAGDKLSVCQLVDSFLCASAFDSVLPGLDILSATLLGENGFQHFLVDQTSCNVNATVYVCVDFWLFL